MWALLGLPRFGGATHANGDDLDIAKSVFQVHGIDAAGNVIIRRQLKRRYVLAFFQKLPSDASRRLDDIPGVGPMLATALVASVADPKAFRSGRDFSAWIGRGGVHRRERRGPRCPAAEAGAEKRLAQGVIANAGFRYDGYRRSNGSVEQT
jgi:hypothetical protein